MSKKGESGSQRREWKRASGVVQKSDVCVYMCRTNMGPQNEWLHRIGKDRCKCGEVMKGAHVVEECPELEQWGPRRAVWKEWREALRGRGVSKKKKEEEEEGDY